MYVCEYEPWSKCLTSWHQIRQCLRHCLHLAYARAQVLLTRISCLTRSLRWLTCTTVLLTPHPYKGPLLNMNTRVLERGSYVHSTCTDCRRMFSWINHPSILQEMDYTKRGRLHVQSKGPPWSFSADPSSSGRQQDRRSTESKFMT